MSDNEKSNVLRSSPSKYQEDEIDLMLLWDALWRGKWIVMGFTLVFSVASVFYALSLPDMYRSKAVLAPAESSSGGGLAKLAGQFGGLASLAGIDLNVSSGSNTAEAIEIIQSWSFIEEFILEQNIAPQVFAATNWDHDTRELILDSAVFDEQSQVWTREPPKGKQVVPSSWELFEKFSEYLNVGEDKASGFIFVEIEYFSPDIARAWVDALVAKINTRFKLRDLEEAERNIAFLREQIESTSITSMQSVFYDLIEDQTKTLMLAKGSTEYVFKTISEARAAEEKSKPKRALICIFGAMLGGVLGVIVALLRSLPSGKTGRVAPHE